ncbi:PEP-CTERM sorting domain-containing protein [Parazoarcus communis]|uniref:PEP-CTERM sorting domain-containing protein n=1 Tax=Parazoarcus communis TaxID=41977 RepID=A0A2U8GNR2_9RHOO|nr:PEP-CTERM sorting domain-containing protein [Parazoarcus communis]AWI75261.1 PEP-CTERM sorting domain-containing protein [Parazoarcus communis]
MTFQKIAAALALCAFTPLSMAAIIASDNFDYATGEVAGQNGGSGWAGAWSANTGVTQVVTPSTSLGGSNALQVTGNNNNAAYRQLSSAFSGNSLFVDFYIQLDAGVLSANDFLGLWLDTASTGDHTNRPNIGIKADGSGTNDVFVRTNGTNGAFAASSNIGTTNDITYHIVGLLSRTAPGNYTSFSMWLDPMFADLSTPDAVMTGNTGLSQINYVGFRSVNLDSGDVLLIDGLQLSTTWSEALRISTSTTNDVPEPGTAALIGLGLLGLGLSKRRKA